MFEIRLAGELEVVRDNVRLDLPASRKTRALLGYLAATGRSHLRSQLCDLLWDGPDDPRAALRWSLTKLRPVLDAGARMVTDREHAQLECDADVVDVVRIRRELAGTSIAKVADTSLAGIAELFRGEFLDGLELADCSPFHGWWQAQRAELRSVRGSVLAELVKRTSLDAEQRTRWARARVAIDPYTEQLHVELIRLLGELGRTREALEQYDHARRLLERELGMRSTSALDTARRELGARSRADVRAVAQANAKADRTDEQTAIDNDSTAPVAIATPTAATSANPGATPTSEPRPDPSWTGSNERTKMAFVGRAAVLDRLVEAIDAVSRTGATPSTDGVIVVSGEPGIGKTRLLEEVVRRHRTTSGTALVASAHEVERVRPYGLWIDALRSMPKAMLPRELAGLLPELGAQTSAPAPSDRAGLLEAIARAVENLARTSRLLVVLDDVQWIDEASAAVLHVIVRSAARIFVVCGARRGEVEDNPAAFRLMRALRRERRLDTIELGPLDDIETATLVRAIDARVDASRVRADSGGNPLFAIEIARAHAAGDHGPPQSLRELVGERLERLEPTARDAVMWAAAFGHRCAPDQLRVAAGLTGGDFVSALDELERRGFLVGDGPNYRFVHDTIRACAYLALSEPRRRVIHGQIARALANDPSAAADVERHAALGGDLELAASSALAAARAALRVFATTEAVTLADRGLRHARQLPRDRATRTESGLLEILVCTVATRRRRELERELLRVASEAQALDLPDVATQTLYVLSILHHDGGDFPNAAETMRRAVEASRTADARTRARSLALAARCLGHIERDIPQAETMLSEADAIARGAGLDVHEIEWAWGTIKQFAGDYEVAARLLARAYEIATGASDHWTRCDCLIRIAMIGIERGDLSAAAAACTELAAAADKLGEGSERTAGRALDALARFAAGAPDAGTDLDAALAALRALDAKGLLSYTLASTALLDVAAGRVREAFARATEALAAAEAIAHKSQIALAHAILAQVAIAETDPERALRHLELGRAEVENISARARSALVTAGAALAKLASALGSSGSDAFQR